MATCTFFGHRDCPETIRPQVMTTVEDLILIQGVDTFYVGDSGRFDAIVRGVLRELSRKYPHIRYGVVLSAMPSGETEADTMLPEEIVSVPPRFAIDRRNRWMLERADIVVTYITHGWGGAAKFAEMAAKSGKIVISSAKSG